MLRSALFPGSNPSEVRHRWYNICTVQQKLPFFWEPAVLKIPARTHWQSSRISSRVKNQGLNQNWFKSESQAACLERVFRSFECSPIQCYMCPLFRAEDTESIASYTSCHRRVLRAAHRRPCTGTR